MTIGWQQTGQSSTYSWLTPSETSSGMTISSPHEGQTYDASLSTALRRLRFFTLHTWFESEEVAIHRHRHEAQDRNRQRRPAQHVTPPAERNVVVGRARMVGSQEHDKREH